MLSLSQVKELLRQQRIMPKKRLGQNFLIDKNINKKIIEEINLTKDDIILEIGAGFGNLTEPMAEKAYKVYAIELDKKIVRVLRENLHSLKNVIIIESDFLKLDLNKIIEGESDRNVKVIGNLPYYISSPIIFHLLKYKIYIDFVLITVQKEVAKRLVAKPHSKDYGILGCLLNFYAQTSIARYISKNSFYPKPKVDSALVKLKFLKKSPLRLKNEGTFIKVIKAGFSKRRKNILNALSSYSEFNFDKLFLMSILEQLKIDPRKRAEDIKAVDFAKISNLINDVL